MGDFHEFNAVREEGRIVGRSGEMLKRKWEFRWNIHEFRKIVRYLRIASKFVSKNRMEAGMGIVRNWMAPSKSDRSSFLGLRDRNANLFGMTSCLLGAGKKFTLDTLDRNSRQGRRRCLAEFPWDKPRDVPNPCMMCDVSSGFGSYFAWGWTFWKLGLKFWHCQR